MFYLINVWGKGAGAADDGRGGVQQQAEEEDRNDDDDDKGSQSRSVDWS
jgi:hypothetical protein